MFFLKWIWQNILSVFKFFWWLITDTIDDLRFLFSSAKKYKNKEEIIDPAKWILFKEEISKLTIGGVLKDNWHWLLAIMFAGVIGWILGGHWCQVQCNNFILDNFGPKSISDTMPWLSNFGNATNLDISTLPTP